MNTKDLISMILCTMVSFSIAGAQNVVIINELVGEIKAMNAVNNGPTESNPNSSTTNFSAYKAAEFPYARLHAQAARCSS